MTLGKTRGAARRPRLHFTAAGVFATGGLRWDRVLLITLDLTLWYGLFYAAWLVLRMGALGASHLF